MPLLGIFSAVDPKRTTWAGVSPVPEVSYSSVSSDGGEMTL